MIEAAGGKLIVGLGIDTTRVAVLMGEILLGDMVNTIGVGSYPSRGVNKGGMSDLEFVIKCAQHAVDQAGLMVNCQISSAYPVLSGKRISCQNEISMVLISEEGVTQEDMKNVAHIAKSVRVRDEHHMLRVIL